VKADNTGDRVLVQLTALERILPCLLVGYQNKEGQGKRDVLRLWQLVQAWRSSARRYLAANGPALVSDRAVLDALSPSGGWRDQNDALLCYRTPWVLRMLGDYQVAAAYLTKPIMFNNPEPYDFEPGRVNAQFSPAAGCWLPGNGRGKAGEAASSKALTLDSVDPGIVDDLASALQEGMNGDPAELYDASAGLVNGNGYAAATYKNYNEIVRRVLGHGAVMVAMQYPLRDVELLRNLLHDQEGVIFIENKKNFQNALKNGESTRYFLDLFAGDFGHCTAAGNRLIADNVADVLEKKGFPNL
jgi:hypothetical protein